MNNTRIYKALTIAVLIWLQAQVGWAVQQTMSLNPGWNAVFLEIEPDDHDPATTDDKRWERIIGGLPIVAVRAWKGTQDVIEFIENPGDITTDSSSNWDAYYPPGSPVEFLTSFWEALPGKSYLIQLDGSTPVDLVVEGNPVLPDFTWKPNSFNFVGFHLEPDREPFFRQFFEVAPALDDQEIYFLNPSTGTWDRITDPDTTQMKSGEAYWIYCSGASAYRGPLEVLNAPLDSVDFGETVTRQTLRIRNYSPIVHQDIPEDIVAKATILVDSTGTLPLSYWIDAPSANAGWNELNGPVFIGNESREYSNLQLSVRRRDMGDASADVLTLTNGQGFRLRLAIGAAKSTDNAGLWVGYASIKRVGQAYDPISPEELKDVHKPFQIRLIVHVDDAGNAKLLQKVIQMWKPGSTAYDDEFDGQVVVESGNYALFADESLIPSDYQGATLVNGQPVGKRISSINFGAPGQWTMAGSFPVSLALTGANAIVVDYDDPLNPYKHAYHPDHDNYNRYYDQTIEEEGKEVFDIKREIELEFTDQDPEIPSSIASTTWGYSERGGIYRESVIGLHKNVITVQGVFRLYRISDIGELNPAN
ncbi:MAG: hypothetical protein GY866_18520 [Proteobacteria bacterium]|nr:hypothetical protein [Pseudomonadota bacterium]